MSRLYYLTYNNYYNRKIKIEGNNASNYISYRVYTQTGNPNFNINDGVTASCVCNSWATLASTPDYLLICDDYDVIKSRWYIMEAVHQSGNQYVINLRRDLIADFRDSVLSADTYIEKGWIPPDNDLIFNTEALELNQIKQSEHLLKDETGVSWAVAYIPDNGDVEKSITTTQGSVYKTLDKLSTWDFAGYINSSTLARINPSYMFYTKGASDSYGAVFPDRPIQRFTVPPNNYIIRANQTLDQFQTEILNAYNRADDQKLSELTEATLDTVEAISGKHILTNVEHDTLLRINNQVLYIQKNEDDTPLNKYYRIKVAERQYAQVFKGSDSANLRTKMYSIWALGTYSQYYHGTFHDTYGFYAKGRQLTLTLEEVSSTNLTIHNTGATLIDQPYRMIAIPYKDENGNGLEFTVGNATYTTNPQYTLQVLKQFPTLYTGDLYSWQLLPYCPCRQCITDSGFVIDNNGGEGLGYELIRSEEAGSSIVGFVLYCQQSSFSFSIDYNYEIDDYKVQACTEMMRICSPNYNGVFEFNPAKNRGITGINVTCTYKPVSPYIKVAPNFGGLYNQDFGDARGLICSGSFDLPQTSSEWIAYERTNSTYQQQFDRNIEHMETEYDINRKNAIAQAVVGTIQGATAGTVAGGFVGSKAIGGVVGGLASLGGGIADLALQNKLHKEAIDYTQDNFNFSLQNIQAIPNTLTKVSSYNSDNKIFPFIELYDCTEVEKTAFRDKIKYNGMTVNVIGHLSDYINPDDEFTYIKGQIIHMDIPEDYHALSEISSEIYKGVYIL